MACAGCGGYSGLATSGMSGACAPRARYLMAARATLDSLWRCQHCHQPYQTQSQRIHTCRMVTLRPSLEDARLALGDGGSLAGMLRLSSGSGSHSFSRYSFDEGLGADGGPPAALFCVLDGHCGHSAAQQASMLLPRELATRIDPRQLGQVPASAPRVPSPLPPLRDAAECRFGVALDDDPCAPPRATIAGAAHQRFTPHLPCAAAGTIRSTAVVMLTECLWSCCLKFAAEW